ncbi:MAG: hypothetical protein CJBNEKGG_03474 [Prosthecobacter sp.]|nr:hypothetical protein [Prosthecobacter sp.]
MEDFFRTLFDFERPITKPRFVWFFILAFIWMIWIVQKADEVHAKEQTKMATASWWDRTVHYDRPEKEKGYVINRGILGLLIIFFLSHLIASIQVSWLQRLSHLIQQRNFSKQALLLEKNSEAQAMLSKTALSKKELIVRLGSIDQFIRVLENETDPARRTVSLQAASAELTALSAKLATGEILSEAIDAPEVQQASKETSFDLAKAGLSEDRLNRDLRRIFKLADAPLALPENRTE